MVFGNFYSPGYLTPVWTLETALAILYVVHTMPNVLLYNTGGDISASGLSPLANPSSSNLLSESSALHLLLSDRNLQGKMEAFLRKPGNSVLPTHQVGFASEEGCMGFLAIVFRRLQACCLFPMSPWVHGCF